MFGNNPAKLGEVSSNMKKTIHSSWESEDLEDGIYSVDSREGLLEDGEIDAWEEAFMSGYDEAG